MVGTSHSVAIAADLPQRRKVLSLRYMGYENEEIASILGISEGSVQYHIKAAVTSSSDRERINFVREAEITKLEQLEEAFMPAALGELSDENGPIPAQASAAKVILDVMDRRSKLLGVDKAQPQISTTNLTLIQILSQIPPPGQEPQAIGLNSEGSPALPSVSYSREATDA